LAGTVKENSLAGTVIENALISHMAGTAREESANEMAKGFKPEMGKKHVVLAEKEIVFFNRLEPRLMVTSPLFETQQLTYKSHN
jgi:hypothetical protein